MKAVELSKIIETLNLKNLTPDIDLDQIKIEMPDINRPALQLSGYFSALCFGAGADCRVRRVYLSAEQK